MNNLIEIVKLKINSRNKLLVLIFAFITGIIIPTVPYFLNFLSEINNKREIELKNKNLIIKLENNCRSKNSKYKKLIDLGFENFALEEFNVCMRESLGK